MLLGTFSNATADDSKVTVDIVLPTKNSALTTLVKKISNKAEFNLREYENSLPEPSQRGEILVVVSDHLLPLLDNNNYRASIALYADVIAYRKHHNEKSSAIFSGQPLRRQLELINALVKGSAARIGVVFMDNYYQEELEKSKSNFQNFDFITAKVDLHNAQRQINKAIQDSNFLLATPERELYNAQSIRGILLASLRHRSPLIGPSESFVTAGAVASVVSQTEHYATALRDMIHTYIGTDTLSAPHYPQEFDVKVNYNVAESLGLNLSGEEALKKFMLREKND